MTIIGHATKPNFVLPRLGRGIHDLSFSRKKKKFVDGPPSRAKTIRVTITNGERVE
jgi:hypothetical protein